MRLACAAVILAVVAIHMMAWMGQVTDPMASWVNAALMARAGVLALPLLRRRADPG